MPKAIDHAEAAGYQPHIRGIAQNATAPVWWSRSSSPIGSAVLHNGTVTLVNTGERTICVTAGHVYSKYLAHKKDFNDLECQIGSVRIDLENYVIDHNDRLDLATFEMSPILLAANSICQSHIVQSFQSLFAIDSHFLRRNARSTSLLH